MMKIKTILSLAFIIFGFHAYPQGCSDAGFCSVGALKSSGQQDSVLKQNAKIIFGYGKGENSTDIQNIIAEIEFNFLKNNFVEIKIPYVFAEGNGGSNSGIGDLVFSLSRAFVEKENSRFSATAGVKLPSGSTDAESKNNLSLPMPYQTGLGTTDLILGASFQYKNWNFGTGYQHVLKHNNKNKFIYPLGIILREGSYFESNLLKRGNDALLRAEYLFNFNRIKITPGILAIIRLQEDKIVNLAGERVNVRGSDGLTLNITASVNYAVSRKINITLLAGAPAVVRKVRPDGLTRSMVLNLGFQYNFNL